MLKRKLAILLAICMTFGIAGCGSITAADGYEIEAGQLETEAEREPEVRSEAEAGFTDDVTVGSDVEIETETESQKESEIESEDPSIFERPEGVVKVGTDFLEEEDMSWATSKEETEEYMDVELDGEDSYEVDFFPWPSDYDYPCYIQDFQQREDGTYQLVILPIYFFDDTDEEMTKAFGIEEDPVGASIHFAKSEEPVTLEVTDNTSYYVVNWRHSRELAKRSKNHCTHTDLCELTDGVLFYKFMRTTYGEGLARYPMFINLDVDGRVKEVVEYPLP